MQIPASKLVRAAMAAAGIDESSPGDLAKKLGLTAYASPRRVSRWRDGDNAPNYDETLALLELAGWLDTAAIRRDLEGEGLDEALAGLDEAEARARRQAARGARARGRRKTA